MPEGVCYSSTNFYLSHLAPLEDVLPTSAQDPAVTAPWWGIHQVQLIKSSEADTQPQNNLGGRTCPFSMPLKSKRGIGTSVGAEDTHLQGFRGFIQNVLT